MSEIIEDPLQGAVNENAWHWHNEYMREPDTAMSPAYLQWQSHGMQRAERASFQLKAGWAAMEAALTPHSLPYLDRKPIVEHAVALWSGVALMDASKQLIEASNMAKVHAPTFNYIASTIAQGSFTLQPHNKQDKSFRAHMRTILEEPHRLGYSGVRGPVVELLVSYFLHRSNTLLPDDPPLISLPSSIRNDHHPVRKMRADLDCYDAQTGAVYRVQVKSGFHAEGIHSEHEEESRILLTGAQKMLYVPHLRHNLRDTLAAIVQQRHWTHKRDLDTVSLALRAKVQQSLKPGAVRRYIALRDTTA